MHQILLLPKSSPYFQITFKKFSVRCHHSADWRFQNCHERLVSLQWLSTFDLPFLMEISFPLGFLRSDVPPALPSKPGLCSRGLPMEHTSTCQGFASILVLSRFCTKQDYKKIKGRWKRCPTTDWSTTIASALKCSGSNESNVCDMTCRSMVKKQDRRTLWQNQLSACANAVPAPIGFLKSLLKMAGSGNSNTFPVYTSILLRVLHTIQLWRGTLEIVLHAQVMGSTLRS